MVADSDLPINLAGQITAIMPSRIGSLLHHARLTAGITQAELAALLGVARPTVTQIEGGKVTTTRVVESWLDACNAAIVVSSAEAPVVQAVARLERDDQILIERLSRILPSLKAENRRTLELLIAGWTPPNVKEM